MAESSVPVDLLNPGQVFACLGLLEAADILCGDAEGAFDWTARRSVRFFLRANGEERPHARVMRFFSEAEVFAEAPSGSTHAQSWLESWGRMVTAPAGAPYPFPDPPSPATLRAVLRSGNEQLVLDHWGDATSRDSAKFWAGGRGYPGAALARDALELVRGRCIEAAEDPFALSAPQGSSFRLDWRRDYIPLDAGFSLNAHHGSIEAVGYPLVELLGALGLTHARPKRVSRQSKLEYEYGVIGRVRDDVWYRPSFLRAALGRAPLPFPSRSFRMFLSWPGKENQARAITHVTEEPSHEQR